MHVVIVDVSSSRISQIKEAWESQRKAYTTEFFEVDPCMVSRFFVFLFLYLVSFSFSMIFILSVNLRYWSYGFFCMLKRVLFILIILCEFSRFAYSDYCYYNF